MGYTHYWNVARDADREKLAEAGRDMALLVNAAEVDVAGWDGHGEPEVGDDGTVRFNGRGPDDNHETFAWPPDLDDPQEFLQGIGAPRAEVFTFCKTARKPYDVVVVACLLRARAVVGATVRVSTDASDPEEFAGAELSEGWEATNAMLGHPTVDHGGETAAALYRRVFGGEPDLAGIFDEEEVEA